MTFTSDYMTMLFQVEDRLSRKVAQCVEEAVEQKFRQSGHAVRKFIRQATVTEHR